MRILVATDLVGRGIDVERVNIVINYDMPVTDETHGNGAGALTPQARGPAARSPVGGGAESSSISPPPCTDWLAPSRRCAANAHQPSPLPPPPAPPDTYLHRVGRAGRFGTKGLAITFVSSKEDSEVLNAVQVRRGAAGGRGLRRQRATAGPALPPLAPWKRGAFGCHASCGRVGQQLLCARPSPSHPEPTRHCNRPAGAL